MSDAEWAVTEPTLPVPAWKQGKGGRPAEWCRRDIVDAIRYLVKEGIGYDGSIWLHHDGFMWFWHT